MTPIHIRFLHHFGIRWCLQVFQIYLNINLSGAATLNEYFVLTPCDGYVSQPQSPVIVVVSNRLTAEKEKQQQNR